MTALTPSGQGSGLSCPWFSPQEVAQYLAYWVGNKHLIIHSVTQCLLNDEWAWWLSGRKYKLKLLRVKDLWINTEGLGVSPAWDSLWLEKCLRGDLSHSIYTSFVDSWLWNVGFIHPLWYCETERAIPFPALKISQGNAPGRHSSSHLIASSLVLSREDTLLKACC